nr:uncharacterized protein CFP56_01924 [Quercus suber]
MTGALSLSREEQEELARSNKKVKNVCHADFKEGSESGPSLPSNSHGQWSGMSSFKDKLVGEIPGAYRQAFSFGDIMEDEEGSDEEVETLRKGLVACRFSREFKQHIRTPWTKAVIVKVFGRSVGFTFLHNRLLSLWKPAGRLDCVDLGHGFFLIRLSLKEDYEAVLRKGPWFIGEHFLSIRPWEPDFRPAEANVNSIAVWVRLNELPIEYYNAEALLHIGKTIGNVLRVDTHTASEARGRFARICVQIDVDKPLVTAVLIGRFEQPVCYEGIQKLCFECGRMGHRKENCPYTIRQDMQLREESTVDASEKEDSSCKKGGSSCEERGTNSDRTSEGSSGIVHESGQECVQEGTYGPWVVVGRKKSGTKFQRHDGSTSVLEKGQKNDARNEPGNGIRPNKGVGRLDFSHGPSREAKRKLPQIRPVEGAQVANIIQSIRQVKSHQTQPAVDPSPRALDVASVSFRAGHDLVINKPNQKGSIKEKKALARAKASQDACVSAVEGELCNSPCANQVDNRSSPMIEERVHRGGDRKLKKGEGWVPRSSFELQITNTPKPELGFKFRGRGNGDASGGASRDSGHAVPGHGLDKQRASKKMEVDSLVDNGESEGDRVAGHGCNVNGGDNSLVASASGCTDGGSNSANGVQMSAEGSDEGNAEAEQMEMEGGGVGATNLG